MKVHLAGYNVDTEVLRQLQEEAGSRQDLTPEVLSEGESGVRPSDVR